MNHLDYANIKNEKDKNSFVEGVLKTPFNKNFH